MPTLTYNVSVRDLGKFERNLAFTLRNEMRKGLQTIRSELVAYLRNKSSHVKDLGLFQKSWEYDVKGPYSVNIYNSAPYAYVIELGRRPGRRPPPYRALTGWCQRKLGDTRLAYIVAKRIGEKGIAARPVLNTELTQRFIDDLVNSTIDQIWLRAVRGAI